MAPARSDQATQGSVGVASSRPQAEPNESTETRVVSSVCGVDMPVNVTLALLPSQSSEPAPRDHTELLSSIDNLFGQRHDHGSVATAPAATRSSSTSSRPTNGRRPSLENALRGVGTRFDGAQPSSVGSSASMGRQ
ncbi:uncharacterized protein GGS22DRAFT_118155 [Annulohypoxylon maeteangense]|uniref:uncharacterized protein n=1 Tax=Annulohypoxylon maeteangense TaxID=1927788 RepID=UPI00200749D3|nr:uncharacterized protein GGS22DRAFT_118155 [Annulohypoxylon maeteangense]KAI0886820.1 hypothetical protein GGS22DRAFT_118155 [Annulohypoxylon maeteangense]